MYYLTRESRLAGFRADDTSSDAGILQAGPGIFHFTMDIYDGADWDGDGITTNDWDDMGVSDGSVALPGEEIIYMLADDAGDPANGLPDTLTTDGTPEPCALSRNDVNGAGNGTLMENVEAIAFAYAFDNNADGFPDRTAGGNIIWAVDTDSGGGDGQLDTILDTNDDGIIDSNDAAGGAGIGTAVNIDNICMVRIWILVKSSVEDPTFLNQNTYVVGLNQLVVDDNFRRRLMSASIGCRNT
jgi:type IV pilus assembly protein PilW